MTWRRSRALRARCVALLAIAAVVASAGSAEARPVYVANRESDSVSVFDSRTRKLDGPAIAVGRGPTAIAFSHDGGTAYVADNLSSAVSVIDVRSADVVGAPIPVGRRPAHIAVSPDDRFVYVDDETTGAISVLDAARREVVGSIPVGEAGQIALSPDGTTAYVPQYKAGGVAVIDLGTRTVTRTIPVGEYPAPIGLSPDGTTAYLGYDFAPTLAAIDLGSGVVVEPAIDVEDLNPRSIAISPDGGTAYVVHLEAGAVAVVDLRARKTRSEIEIPVRGLLTSIALTPDGRLAFVSNLSDNSVSVIDTQANRVLGDPVRVEEVPRAVAMAPLDSAPVAAFSAPAGVRLGAPLTFDPSASHDDGAIARLDWDFGDGGTASQDSVAAVGHVYRRPGTFTVTLTATDDEGCSAGPSASYCRTTASARASRRVTVLYPRVRVRCPAARKPVACRITLRAVSGRRRGRVETASARASVKAGHSATVVLKPRPRFLGKLGVAKTVLVRETVRVGGATSTSIRRLTLR